MISKNMVKTVGILVVSALGLGGCNNSQVMLDEISQVVLQGSAPTSSESSTAIRQALFSGVSVAVSTLGRPNGFYGTPLQIPLPRQLRNTARVANTIGLHRYVTQFETSMNRAAEKAVPVAVDVFSNAISQMTIQDAIGLIKGGDNSVTNYFKRTSSTQLQSRFLPIVKRATASTNVTKRYKSFIHNTQLASVLSGSGVAQKLDIDAYITQKTVDALFVEIAKQESTIRANPLQASTSLMRRVFSYYR